MINNFICERDEKELKKKIIYFIIIIFFCYFCFLFDKESNALENERNIDPSMWSYVDGLGRTGTVNVNKGDNKDRLVGIFYWTWHLELNGPGPYNVNNIIEKYPDAKNDYNNSIWEQYNGGYYWWNEPVFGYYNENDEYVLRKHAELLADAGVDFIVFDCTNGSFTWESAYEKVLKVWLEAMNDGVNVPKISFMFPFGYSDDTSGISFMKIYNNLYSPVSDNYKRYHELLFCYNGKPFILMAGYKNANDEIKNILKDFEVRENDITYFKSGVQNHGGWGWLSTYPQAYYKNLNGGIEQISVGIAQNANYETNELTAMNGNSVMGRSYAKGDYSYTYKYHNKSIIVGDSITGSSALYDNTSYYGRNFQQQWDYALEIDPNIVFVTGWNEWIMMRFEKWSNTTNAFPDQFNDEYSRDIEPSNGELKDYYYYQLVDNVRKYKGTSNQTFQNDSISINKLSDWNDSRIISYEHYIGGKNRNSSGFGNSRYTNNTFRNDIKTSKVSYDESYIYFYVETVNDLTSSSDNKWMRLLIDTVDSENSTSTENWEEFEYIVNRNAISDNTMILEKSVGGWNFKTIGKVSYDVNGNVLQIKIPRSYLGLTNDKISFNFKWCDNNLDNGNIMTIYTDGDSAPGGRFAFHFEGKIKYVDNSNIEFGENLIVDNDNKYIKQIKVGTTVSMLLNDVNLSNGNVVIESKNGNEKNGTDVIYTGDKVVVYYNDVKEEYVISVVGDVSGDGMVNSLDLILLRKHIVQYKNPNTGVIEVQNGIFELSLDISNEGIINSLDLVRMRKKIVGLE